MASIKFIVKGKKTVSNLYVRFYHSKEFDHTVKTGLLINANQWNNKSQRFKNVSEKIIDKSKIIEHTNNIKKLIVSEYNQAQSEGELISKLWLQNVLDHYNNRPKDGNDFEIYFTSFVEKWIEESKTRINLSTGQIIDIKTIRKYNTTLSRLKDFEKFSNMRLKHIDIGLDFHKDFVSYLSIEGRYGGTTIEKYISQIKMFCREAEICGYKINPQFKSRKFTFKREKPLDPYLNIEEINKIFHLEIEDDTLSKIKDLFIIGLWT